MSSPSSDHSASTITGRNFAVRRKGFDPDEVRAYLGQLAEVVSRLTSDLVGARADVKDLERAAEARPEIDEDQLTTWLGEETARVLSSARKAAVEMKERAEESVARMLREAAEEAGETRRTAESEAAQLRSEAQRVRSEADEARRHTQADAESDAARVRAEAEAAATAARDAGEVEQEAATVAAGAARAAADADAAATRAAADEVLGVKSAEADLAAEAIRTGAEAEADAVRATAEDDADAIRTTAMAERDAAHAAGREMVAEAQRVRERMLADLARRRKAARVQLEQLQAGRERLLESYDAVQAAMDEATAGLRAALPAARQAAEAARLRAESEAEASVEQLEAQIGAARAAGLPLVAPDDRESVEEDLGRDEASVVPDDAADGATPEELAAGAPADDDPDEGGATADVPADDDPDEGGATSEVPADDAPDDPDAHGRAEADAPARAEANVAAAAGAEADDPVEWRPKPEPDPQLVTARTDTRPADAEVAAPSPDSPPIEAPGSPADSPPIEAPASPTDSPAIAPDPAEVETALAPSSDSSADEPEEEVVDELFARLRASRQATVAHAHQVLKGDVAGPAEPGAVDPPVEAAAPDPGSDRDPDPDSAPDSGRGPAPIADPTEPAATVPVPGDASASEAFAPPGAEEELVSLLERRDGAIAPIENRIARKLKRVLADEQGQVLDGVRRLRGHPSLDDILPVDEQVAAYAAVVGEDLVAAAEEGAAFEHASLPTSTTVEEIVAELARSLAGVVRPRVERCFAAGEDADDTSDRLRATYREWKTDRLVEATRHHVLSAFGEGQCAVRPAGILVRWVPDPAIPACPDCEDDALAGSVPSGEPFPTGHAHPPAHPGCRCLVVGVRVAAPA